MVTTKHGIFKSRWVINSAGLGCGKISDICKIIAMAKICVKRQKR